MNERFASALPTHLAPAPAPAPGARSLQQPSERAKAPLIRDERGLASIEYVILLVAVTLGAMWAVLALGFTLVDAFGWQTGVLGLPVP